MKNELINVYDFDKTIYDGDSTVDFYKYCIRHCPSVMLRWPELVVYGPLFLLKLMEKTAFKQKFYKFLKSIPDVDKMVLNFWESYRIKIKKWYLDTKTSSDLISSASPEFLLKPICAQLGVRLVASLVDSKTGKYSGMNNHGIEKVRRLKEEYPDIQINEFYSDSVSDDPLAKMAKKAYLVKKNTILDWPI